MGSHQQKDAASNYLSLMPSDRCSSTISWLTFTMRRIASAKYLRLLLASGLLLILLSTLSHSPFRDHFPHFHRHEVPNSISFLRSARTPSSWPVTPLVSKRNFWGIPENIEFPALRVFNPSIISLPTDGNNSHLSLVVVAREYGHRT